MSYTFQCPICKRSYDTIDRAKYCLADCLEEDLQYACPYCEDIFDSKREAAQCAVRCYIKENGETFGQNTGQCTTCANADAQENRIFPCPHRLDVPPPDLCNKYDPDVRHFGTHLATNFQLENVIQEPRHE